MTSSSPSAQPAWSALTVRPRHEKKTAGGLARMGLEHYLPLYRARRRWSDRIRELDLCLFPGYVFCRFPHAARLAVLNLPGVTSVVSFGTYPAAVPNGEIQAIKDILSSGRRAWPWPLLRTGQKVRIEHGPLAGLTGTLAREKNEWCVVVNIELLGRGVAVEVEREMISVLARNAPPKPPSQPTAGIGSQDSYAYAQA